MLGLAARDRRARCERLIESFGIRLVALTDGEHGSLLVTADSAAEHPGYKVRVVDTIGCGDVFTATLAHCFLRRTSPQEAGEMADRMGAWVATRAGATPEVEPQTVERVVSGRAGPHAL